MPIETQKQPDSLSPWWRHTTILILILGLTVLTWLAFKTYDDAPPIPARALSPVGNVVFTSEDILAGQEIFLRSGLMNNGSIWGHGAYLGPDYAAEYLHTLAIDVRKQVAQERYQSSFEHLELERQLATDAATARILKENRYDSVSRNLILTAAEVDSFRSQIEKWKEYFATTSASVGLPAEYLRDEKDLHSLTSFFAWTAWASVANRPGRSYSYTNNFPYDPTAGNRPPSEAILWSALSLIAFLAGLAVILFAVGRFDFLGWKSDSDHVHPQLLPGESSDSQRATVKYFTLVGVLFLIQVMVGGATAHYRADPSGFYGIDLSDLMPSHLARTWHLQLAIFWVATAYVAGGLFLAPAVGRREPPGQARAVNVLFAVFGVVIFGSLLGEMLSLQELLGELWFWAGHQGWEYLELGRGWQVLLALGLIVWLALLFRGIAPAWRDPERREIASLFLYSAAAIPLFYLPAMFFDGGSHFSVADTWRFWIIHLWVEGFFELFVTVMVAVMFHELGIISRTTAARVVYLDAILYLGSGILGTGHHWYWTGQSTITMALGATFSAMEVIPLTLLTLDAWDFVKLTRGSCDVCGQLVNVPHKWTFYFLMAVGFWNFVGAGVFGFLINLPIVSYFQAGTMLTPNHGHAAMMGVFGMLALALSVFAFRQVSGENSWAAVERYVQVSFWGLNVGLAGMVLLTLFPGGVLQLWDVLENGYWHARGPGFSSQPIVQTIEWLRLPADAIFIGLGVVPMVIAGLKVSLSRKKT